MTLSRRSIANIFILLMVAVLGFVGGFTVSNRQLGAGDRPLYSILATLAPRAGGDTATFRDVWDTIHTKYVNGNINDSILVQGAIQGLVQALGDPYTVYLTKDEAKSFQDEISGSFEGVGMELGRKNDKLTIIAPLNGSPAEKAGIRPGDVILSIDGVEAQPLSLDEAVKKIRGKQGTVVTLLVQRSGAAEPITVKITRGTITVESVTRANVTRNGRTFTHLKISGFNNDTDRLFRQAAQQALNDNTSGFIIDLRNNPGGYLDQAVRIASAVMPSGPVVSEVDRDGKKRNLDARGNAILSGQKIVVLINGGSASASEIVAGAFQDSKVATIIGEKSYGKGSVQELSELGDGSNLKVTIAKWLTPSGRSISEEGITPDIEVKLTVEDYNADRDPQLDAAIDHLSKS